MGRKKRKRAHSSYRTKAQIDSDSLGSFSAWCALLFVVAVVEIVWIVRVRIGAAEVATFSDHAGAVAHGAGPCLWQPPATATVQSGSRGHSWCWYWWGLFWWSDAGFPGAWCVFGFGSRLWFASVCPTPWLGGQRLRLMSEPRRRMEGTASELRHDRPVVVGEPTPCPSPCRVAGKTRAKRWRRQRLSSRHRNHFCMRRLVASEEPPNSGRTEGLRESIHDLRNTHRNTRADADAWYTDTASQLSFLFTRVVKN